MTKDTKKLIRDRLIRYSIAFSPIVSGGLLLIFGDASDWYSQKVVVLSVSQMDIELSVSQMVFGLSVLVTVSLVFYNFQADKLDPDNLYKIEPRRVDQALIVSLWVFGAIGVLFRDWVLNLEIYFQTITALAVMYVLLVAFRIDRLVRRTAEEEEFMLDLMDKAVNCHTIYRHDVEDVIVSWRGLCKETKEKVEDHVIEKLNESRKKEEGIDFMRRELANMGVELAWNENLHKIMLPENEKDKSKIEKCATDLLALRSIIEIMEKIDKDKFEKGLTDSYHRSMADINKIKRWETEKVKRSAPEMPSAKRRMQWLEKRLQEWEEENPELKKEFETEKAELEKQVQEWEKKKANHQKKADERIVKFKEFQSNFTKFINSRQHGNNHTELIATGLIGFVLVALMHLGVPKEGFERFGAFSVHLFTLFTSTIVVFLFFRILDLQIDRDRPLHDVVPEYFGPEYFGPDYLGPDFPSELWKGPIHRIYKSPDKKWIFIISAVTAIFYVLLYICRAFKPDDIAFLWLQRLCMCGGWWDKLVSPFPFLY